MKLDKNQQQKLYDFLDYAVNQFSYTASLDDLRAHRKENGGKDKEKRFRWDIFYMAKKHQRADMTTFLDSLGRGVNDDHIDTVLKQWLAKRPQLSVRHEVQP